MLMALYGILSTGTSVYLSDSSMLQLQQQARTGMHRIVTEARESSDSTIAIIDADSDVLTITTPSETGVVFRRSGNNLIRTNTAVGSTERVLATDIGHLKFTKTGAKLTIALEARSTVYGRNVSFPLTENVRLRNE